MVRGKNHRGYVFFYHGPSFLKILGWASHLKIVNVDAEEKLLCYVSVQTFPSFNTFEAAFGNGFVAMFLPK